MSLIHSVNTECSTMCQNSRENEFLKTEMSIYYDTESSDVNTIPDAVRNARETLYPSFFPLKNLCQNTDPDRALIITVDNFDGKAK